MWIYTSLRWHVIVYYLVFLLGLYYTIRLNGNAKVSNDVIGV